MPNESYEMPVRGGITIVSIEDKPMLDAWKWSWGVDSYGYVASHQRLGKHRSRKVRLHRLIMGDPPAIVDHMNCNRLDNRRENLRVCSESGNSINRIARPDCTSKYKGVSWDKLKSKFRAQIGSKGRIYYLGLFTNEEDAARAYDSAAMRMHGAEFARLNFPMCSSITE